MERDENLRGNEKIEEVMREMQASPTEETLARVLTAIRGRMKEKGHFVVAVRNGEREQLSLRPVSTGDGRKWFAAFTSMDQQLKKQDSIVSGFTAEIGQIFETALDSEGIAGVILNPWDGPILLDRQILLLILG